MARVSHSERIAIWQQRLDRYAISNQTVTDFCKTEGVSVPSFYQWKRRLSTPHRDPLSAKQTARDRRPLQDDKGGVTPFTELVVSGQPTTAKAQLPNGVSIYLGCDQAIAQAIVDRLLAYEPSIANYLAGAQTDARSASRSSC